MTDILDRIQDNAYAIVAKDMQPVAAAEHLPQPTLEIGARAVTNVVPGAGVDSIQIVKLNHNDSARARHRAMSLQMPLELLQECETPAGQFPRSAVNR
jgi:hypothetical protein